MRKKWLAVGAAALTVMITLFVHAGLPQARVERFIQHERMPPSPAGVDGLACIRPTASARMGYDAAAIDLDAFVTHLPLLEIDTRGQEIPGAPYHLPDVGPTLYTLSPTGESTIRAALRIRETGEAHTIEQTPDVTAEILLRVRGNSSRWFDKKSYALRTVKQDGEKWRLPLLGMDAHDDWALHGPFLDKTLLRNYLGMNIAGQMMVYAPDVRFCELVLNGEYRGVYLLMETVSRGQGRVDIQSPSKEKNVSGYIVQFDSSGERSPKALDNFTDYTFVLKRGAQLLVEYPGTEDLSAELRRFVERDVSAVERALYSYDYDSPQYGYWNDLDVEAFADYFILMEVFEMHDTGNLSTYFYREVGGKIKPCVWDFNNCSGNYSVEVPDDYFVRKFVTVQAPWFWMMCKDERFTDLVIRRYHEWRKDVLSDEALTRFLEDAVLYLGAAVDRNYAVWGYSFDAQKVDFRNKLHPDEKNPADYEAAVRQLHAALINRLHWLDDHIEILSQYSHESAVKKFNP